MSTKPAPHEPRCGQCIHWGGGIDTDVYRTCGAVIHDKHEQARRYALEAEEDSPESASEWREIHTLKAVVQDRSGYYAALVCREDFGCVLFERMEESA